jgi:hypothetical protein
MGAAFTLVAQLCINVLIQEGLCPPRCQPTLVRADSSWWSASICGLDVLVAWLLSGDIPSDLWPPSPWACGCLVFFSFSVMSECVAIVIPCGSFFSSSLYPDHQPYGWLLDLVISLN